MNVLITGGAGFLGKRLAKQLLQRGVLKNAQGVEEKIDELVLFDMVAAEGFDDPRVKVVTGNISDLGGPTANMYRLACKDPKIEASCRKPACVYPDICQNLNTDHSALKALYRPANCRVLKKC